MPHKLKKIADQVIVVTGASSGIGLMTAYKAAAQGARVVLAARNEAALQDAVQHIRGLGGQATHVAADVAKSEDVGKIAQAAIEAFGGFDTWVNNAGVGIFGRLEEVPDEDARRLFDVNFWGLVYGTKAAAAHLKAKGGAIVNLGSVASDVALPLQGMYSASKHAIKGFTDGFRMELEEAGTPVSITLIKPTSINTPFPSHSRNYMAQDPKLPPPVYAPEDVAEAIIHAAAHGGRDYYIGGGGKVMSSLNKRFPTVVDWVGSRAGPRQSTLDRPSRQARAGNLFEAGADGAVHGDSPHVVMRSVYTKMTMNPVASGVALVTTALAGGALLRRRSRD